MRYFNKKSVITYPILSCIQKSKTKPKNPECDTFFESWVWYIFTFRIITRVPRMFQNMFKRDDLQHLFGIFLTGCRLFGIIKNSRYITSNRLNKQY